jgi:hypothetical protein
MLTPAVSCRRSGSEAEWALAGNARQAQNIMVLRIQGCVEHALKEDAAGIFNKPSRQPSLVRALNVVAAETSLAFPVTKKPRSKPSRDRG